MGSRAAVAIIGIVAENDFQKAKMIVNEFAQYCDYEDYCAMRESLQVGLAMAGVHATMRYFSLSALMQWRELNCKLEGDAHDLWIGTATDPDSSR